MKQFWLLSFLRFGLPLVLASCSTRCAEITQTRPVDLLPPEKDSIRVSGPGATQTWLVGIGTHLLRAPSNVAPGIAVLKALGVNALREDIRWRAIEPQRGIRRFPQEYDTFIDSARAANIEPLVILDYGHPQYEDGVKPQTLVGVSEFADYARFVAGHLGKRVDLYEVWNEWDGKAGNTQPGSAESYAMLAQHTYRAVKEVAPHSKVLVGAATSDSIDRGFLRRLLELGALEWADGISMHTYIHCRRDTRPELWFEWVQDQYEAMRSTSGQPFDLYVTEMGWPAHTGKCGHDPVTQAKYLARLLLLGRTLPYLKGLWWYDLADDGDDANEMEHNFGVVRRDLSLKPAATALINLTRLVTTMTPTKLWKPVGETLWGIKFEGPSNSVWALWISEKDRCFSVELTKGELTVQNALSAPHVPPFTIRGDSNVLRVSDEVLLVSAPTHTIDALRAQETRCSPH